MMRTRSIRGRSVYVLAGLASLMALLVYLPALRNDFVNWDDYGYVVEKIQIRALDWAFVKWAFMDLSHGFWHPLTFFSYALDYAVWGLNPLGYHLTAIVLHAINTFLVVLLFVRLSEAAGAERPALLAAFVGGLLFGLHPLHVESVVWVSERKDLLCALFFLLSILAYLRSVPGSEGPTGPVREAAFRATRWYLLALAFFVLALASKTMAVSLPAVLMLLDWYPLRRLRGPKDLWPLLGEKVPFLAGSVIISVVSIIGQKAIGALSYMDVAPLPVRILVAFRSLCLYLVQMVLPRHLLPLYPYPKDVALLSFRYGSSIALIAGISAACLIVAKKRPVWLSAWSYYLVTLLPVLGLVQVGYFPMADRFTYLPSLGPFLIAGLGAAAAWEGTASWRRRMPAVNLGVAGLALVLAVVCSYLTVRQIALWKDSITLWSHVIEREGHRVPTAYNNRGVTYAELHQTDRALEDLNTAVSLEPNPLAYNNRGRVYRDLGEPARALDDYTAAIELDPTYYVAYNNRGVVLKDMGQSERALKDYARAIELNPNYAESYTNRGIVYGERGELGAAVEAFTEAIRVNPYYADAYTGRGLEYERSNRLDLALDDLNRAVALSPSSVEAHLNRGVVLERLMRYEEAIEEYGKAIKLDPEDPLAYRDRGVVFGKTGRCDLAVADQSQALALRPDYVQAYLDRGDCFRRMGDVVNSMDDYEKACALGRNEACRSARALRRR